MSFVSALPANLPKFASIPKLVVKKVHDSATAVDLVIHRYIWLLDYGASYDLSKLMLNAMDSSLGAEASGLTLKAGEEVLGIDKVVLSIAVLKPAPDSALGVDISRLILASLDRVVGSEISKFMLTVYDAVVASDVVTHSKLYFKLLSECVSKLRHVRYGDYVYTSDFTAPMHCLSEVYTVLSSPDLAGVVDADGLEKMRLEIDRYVYPRSGDIAFPDMFNGVLEALRGAVEALAYHPRASELAEIINMIRRASMHDLIDPDQQNLLIDSVKKVADLAVDLISLLKCILPPQCLSNPDIVYGEAFMLEGVDPCNIDISIAFMLNFEAKYPCVAGLEW